MRALVSAPKNSGQGFGCSFWLLPSKALKKATLNLRAPDSYNGSCLVRKGLGRQGRQRTAQSSGGWMGGAGSGGGVLTVCSG